MHFCGFTVIVALCFSAAQPLQGSLTFAGAPVQPCQAPVQWEGRIVEYDHNTGLNTRAMMSYDGLNQQIMVLEEKRGHVPCKKYFEYIYLFKSAVLFQIEQVTKLCSKIPLTEAWDPYDIPDNSTYEDQYVIGGPGDMIQVQEWSDRNLPGRVDEAWVGVYTVKDCYPVQETYTKNSSVTTSTRFFDLRLGISDPSVFTPRNLPECSDPEDDPGMLSITLALPQNKHGGTPRLGRGRGKSHSYSYRLNQAGGAQGIKQTKNKNHQFVSDNLANG